MNDDFLKQVCPSIRLKFKESLRERLAIVDAQSRHITSIRVHALRVAVALIVVFCVTLIASKEARAFLYEVAGFVFNVVETPEPIDETQVTVFPVPHGNLAAAQAAIGFPLHLPEYVPEGYQMLDDVDYASSGSWVSIQWVNSARASFSLLIQQLDEPPGWAYEVGPDSVEEVEVNGSPAALVRGQWVSQWPTDAIGGEAPSSEQWQGTGGLLLIWEQDGLYYSLRWYPDIYSRMIPIPLEDLFHMAESIP